MTKLEKILAPIVVIALALILWGAWELWGWFIRFHAEC